ncbi:MAG TPA: serine/threonine-protein kinase [Urbifossiella sp.]|nr:serine/threonine-protein kinase [Urbifossiella sp.]
MSPTVSHPPREQLKDYVVGLGSDAARLEIDLHLGECDSCAASLDSLASNSVDEVVRSYVASQDDPALPPPFVGQYKIVRELGRGGMATVYLAVHPTVKCEVALKLMHEAFAGNPAMRERFHRDNVLVSAQMNHPNVVRVLDAGEADGVPYVVMEYAEGETLAQKIRERVVLPVATVVNVATKLTDALKYLSSKGVVHRDIKPENVILTDAGEVKLLDLGLARTYDRGAAGGEHTQFGTILGTPRYMPPEQARSPAVDARADIYSLGYTLYSLLTATFPFPDKNGIELFEAHREEEPTPVWKLRAGVPKWLLTVLEKMMAKNVRDRFQSPAELAEALDSGAGGGRPRRPILWLVAAAVVLVAGGGWAAVAQVGPFERERGLNEILTTEAFEAYKRNDYESAKKKADECVSEFRGRAADRQKELVGMGAPKPPTGKVPRSLLEWIRGDGPSVVLQEGPLNDVSVSYWLSGRSAIEIGKGKDAAARALLEAEARTAFEAGQLLTYARCWDPKTKLLWEPALKCTDELANLNDGRK